MASELSAVCENILGDTRCDVQSEKYQARFGPPWNDGWKGQISESLTLVNLRAGRGRQLDPSTALVGLQRFPIEHLALASSSLSVPPTTALASSKLGGFAVWIGFFVVAEAHPAQARQATIRQSIPTLTQQKTCRGKF